MAGPLIPYIELPELDLTFLVHLPILGGYIDPADPPSIKPFGTLVALGVYIGSILAMRHAKERGLDPRKMNSFILYVVGIGFIGAHVLDALFYHPHRVARDPLYLLQIWAGLSSYGGFIGAICGALYWKYRFREKILPYCEMVCSAFPLAWCFGRAGCASVHDHPGIPSNAWYAVKCQDLLPCDPSGEDAGRLDLGLIEFAFTVPLAIAFLILWRKPRRLGFFAATMCVAYAPVRFVLDFLRAPEGGLATADPRYGGLTPAQWASIALLIAGIAFLHFSRSRPPFTGVPAAGAGEGQPDDLDDEDEDDDEDAKRRRERAKARRRRARARLEAKREGGDDEKTEAVSSPAKKKTKRPAKRTRARKDRADDE